MARSRTFPADGQPQLLTPGDYGPLDLDGFSRLDADFVRFTFPRQPDWPELPGNPDLFTLFFAFGDDVRWRIAYGFPRHKRTGLLLPGQDSRFGLPVERGPDGLKVKSERTTARAALRVHVALSLLLIIQVGRL